jgi:hypothetical protein
VTVMPAGISSQRRAPSEKSTSLDQIDWACKAPKIEILLPYDFRNQGHLLVVLPQYQ